MTKNPIINSISAFVYIICIALLMNWGTKNVSGPDTWLAPVLALSVFTLSAAVMAYTFGFYPIIMYFEGKKKEAVKLALATILYFGIITVTLMALIFGRIIK